MLGSQGLYDVIKTQLNKKAELYIDCDMKHGLEEGLSDFGIGDTVNNKKVQTYIVQRAATFFQYIMNQGRKINWHPRVLLIAKITAMVAAEIKCLQQYGHLPGCYQQCQQQ